MSASELLFVAVFGAIVVFAARLALRRPSGRCISCDAPTPPGQLKCTDCWEADAW